MCMIDHANLDERGFSISRWPVARKQHRCEECGRFIEKGESYRRIGNKYDGHVYTFKVCTHCDRAASWLHEVCGGSLIGAVRDDLEAHWHESPEYCSFHLGRLIVGMRRGWKKRNGELMSPPPITTKEMVPRH